MAILVVTIVGDNEPGIIHRIASRAAECDANWLESHLSNLAGKFAGVIELEVDSERVGQLSDALKALSNQGLEVIACEAGKPASRNSENRQITLELTGQDHPGIVNDISAAVSEMGVSIERFDTNRQDTSMAGGQLFSARARLAVPASVDTATLNDKLEALSHDMTVDIVLSRQL